MRRAIVLSFLCLNVSGAVALGACTGDDPTLVASVDSGTCAVGGEGCTCTSGSVCNAGLECRSNLCVASDAGSGGQDSGGGGGAADVDAAGADAGCLSLVKAGQDQPGSIVDTGDGLAWVNLGASPAVVLADYAGVLKKSIPAPAANGAIAFEVSGVVWADGMTVHSALTNGNLETTVATPGYTIGVVATTSGEAGPSAYFTEANNGAGGIHYCPLAMSTCTSPSTVAATVGANVEGIAGRAGVLYWTEAAVGGHVRSCAVDTGCTTTTDYGVEPHPPIFIGLSNGTPFWTTFMTGSLRSQNDTIAIGTPAGLYYGLATDGETIFFQALDSVGNGGIYAVKATASSASGKFIAAATFPKTFGLASGVAYGNKHFYWTDQATNSIYSWDAACPF